MEPLFIKCLKYFQVFNIMKRVVMVQQQYQYLVYWSNFIYQLLCYQTSLFADSVNNKKKLITSKNLSFQYTEEFQKINNIQT
ncbi:unnamed protein product [Paramecium pentaurelia]|uniref:Uncharacterized protein n=1 Tax=Paramecium pentaurelia TaxID=43138 RepID=A0A8S1SIV5_9CILI|nr:unnamed protein product [Paramecium pentaurelia]